MLRAGILFILFALLLPDRSTAQFNDDFSDGNFTSDPAWSGDDALFVVSDDGGNNRLRSNNPGAATYHLSTPSTQATNAQWEFFIDLRFATSGANYVDVYLISPQADLNPRPDGYFVRIGDTQDHIVLYRREASTNTALVSSPTGTIGSSSSNPFRIRVTRDVSNNWTLFYHSGETGTFLVAGTSVDATLNTSTHFGVLIVQSTAASAVNNHFFDDFVVSEIPIDEDPPQLLSATVIDANNVDLVFNEALSTATAENAINYSADNGLGQPASATLQGASVVRLTFPAGFVSGTNYTVTVNGVEDLAGNAITNETISFLYFVPDDPTWREVVLNELMADPTPSQGLPDSEYIELFNATTDKYFDLEGWQITTNSTQATLPAYALAPGEYVVLVNNNNLPLFSSIGNVIGTSLSSTALVNGGTTVTLLDATDEMIDQVAYDDGWYGSSTVSDGGWSLEQIDPNSPCSGEHNWSASNASSGGTPAAQNSIYDPTPDTTAPQLTMALLADTFMIELVFNEPMDTESLLAGSYSISPDLGITEVQLVPGNDRRVRMTVDQAPELGVFYTVTVTGVTDCTGNPIANENSAVIAVPEPAAPLDIIINEVMYDPATGSSEFVELYNNSQKVIDLAGMYIGRELTDASNQNVITSTSWILMPGEYVVLTTSINDVVQYYPQSLPDRFIQTSLPSLTNSGGTVSVLDTQLVLIDHFVYDPNMHFELVSDSKGFSLERVDPNRPTQDETNWQTASEPAGRATPGYQNSQYAPAPSATGTMTIDPSIFSPDNDGYQDVLTITYAFEQDGFIGTMLVFDVAGREVKRLMDNKILGTTGSISWDGILDNGSKGRMGPYIVMMEAFDIDGNVERFKKTVTLAHFLD